MIFSEREKENIFAMYRLPENLFKMIIFLILFIVLICCDHSGLTKSIKSKFSGNSIFYSSKSKKYRVQDMQTEYYKTATFFFLLVRFLTPRFGWLTMGLGILFPIMSIIRYIKYSTKISFSSADKDKMSPTATTILLSGAILLIWGIENHEYNILFWIWWIVVAVIFVIPFFVYSKEYKKKKTVALGFCLCILLFSFGAVCNINSQYDFSEPEEYRVMIIDKYETTGRSTTYYVTIGQWDGKINEDVSVSMYDYQRAEIGEHATIVQHQGLLGIEWYYLEIE